MWCGWLRGELCHAAFDVKSFRGEQRLDVESFGKQSGWVARLLMSRYASSLVQGERWSRKEETQKKTLPAALCSSNNRS